MTDDLLKASAWVPKGGVGKTTTIAHTAVAAEQEHDLDTLILDLAGVQNDVARHFGIRDQVVDPDKPVSSIFDPSFWDWLDDDADPVTSMAFETPEGPDLIPSDEGLSGADNNLASLPREDRFGAISQLLDEYAADQYDLVLIDLPGVDNNIVISALVATQHVVAPLRPGEFERDQLGSLQSQLDTLTEGLDTDLSLAQILTTHYDRRGSQSEAFHDDLTDEYGDLVPTKVVHTADIAHAQADGETLFARTDDELYDTGREARENYRTATDHLLEAINDE